MLIPNNVSLVSGGIPASTNYQYMAKEGNPPTATWGTTATAGVIDTSMHNNRILGFRVASLTSVTVGYRVEGRFKSGGRWGNVYTASIASVGIIDQLYTVTQPFYEMRVGWRVAPSPTATVDSVVYCDISLTEEG